MTTRDQTIAAWTLSDSQAFDAVQVLGSPPIRVDSNHRLWSYQDGVWLPSGVNEIQRRLRILSSGSIQANKVSAVREIAKYSGVTINIEDAYEHSANTQRINVANGTLDLRAQDEDHGPLLTPWDPEDMFLNKVPHDWDPTAKCDRIDEVLLGIWDGDTEMLDFIYEVVGSVLLPGLDLKRAYFLHSGPGTSGKSMLCRIINRLVGIGSSTTITLTGMERERFQLANLQGKMLATGEELSDSTCVTSTTFKSLVGGDRVHVQRKGEQGFDMTNRAKLFFAGNSFPATTDTSDAYFDRWVVIPFPRKFAKTAGFEEPLFREAEMEGLLVRAARGAQRLLNRGQLPTYPPAVAEAHCQYRHDGDPVRQFIDTATRPTPGKRWAGQELYRAYSDWSNACGYNPLGIKRFYGRLKEVPGVAVDKAREGAVVVGLSRVIYDRPGIKWLDGGDK